MRTPIIPATLSWICIVAATVLVMQSCKGSEVCEATYYSSDLQGNYMANGFKYDENNYTCATFLFDLGTELKVTYEDKVVWVLVTDRCDNLTDIDLSKVAFEKLAPLSRGRIDVRIEKVVQ